MRKLELAQLTPGLIVADNVFNYNKQLILPIGTKLSNKTITKLAFYSISNIYVEDEKPIEVIKASQISQSYSERIKNSPEFQRFAVEFEKDVRKFKKVMNAVVKQHAPFDINDLMQDVLALLHNNEKGKVHIFEILNNMRQFDDLTYAHSINVALICNIFAGWLGMSKEETNLVTQCGLLHDMGKLKVPEKIIKKPGKLTNEEFNVIKTHPLAGYEILSRYKINPHIINAAMMHHEKCDGSGYPLSLKGDKIDKFAKIVSIADVYDAMTSVRVYRGAMCPFKVIEIFEQEGLQKYDTHYIITFIENVLNTYIQNRVRLTDGRVGEIVMINKRKLSRPLIRCGTEYVDLSKEPLSLGIAEIV